MSDLPRLLHSEVGRLIREAKEKKLRRMADEHRSPSGPTELEVMAEEVDNLRTELESRKKNEGEMNNMREELRGLKEELEKFETIRNTLCEEVVKKDEENQRLEYILRANRVSGNLADDGVPVKSKPHSVGEGGNGGGSTQEDKDNPIETLCGLIAQLTTKTVSDEKKFYEKEKEKNKHKLPEFTGELPTFVCSNDPEEFMNIEIFIKQLEFAMPTPLWSDSQRVAGGMKALRGGVLAEMRGLPISSRNTWALFKNALRNKYELRPTQLAQMKKAFNPRRKTGEDLFAYVCRVRCGLENFDPHGNWDSATQVSELIAVIEGDLPSTMGVGIVTLEDTENSSLKKFADAWSWCLATQRKESFAVAVRTNTRGRGTYVSRGRGGPKQPAGRGASWKFSQSPPGEKKKSNSFAEKGATGYTGGQPVCYTCGHPSHFAKDCDIPRKCFNCGKRGHLAAQCYKRNQHGGRRGGGRGGPGSSYREAKNGGEWGVNAIQPPAHATLPPPQPPSQQQASYRE